LNFTAGVPTLKFAPVTVTLVPIGPNAGVKPKIVGCTTKFPLVVSEPAGAFTRSWPVAAFVGTEAWTAPLLKTVNVVAYVDPNKTSTTPERLFPVISTLVPVRPE